MTFSSKVLGLFFRCCCRCRNYDDFLLQSTFQDAPKLNLVALAPFGPSGGSLRSLLFLVGLEVFFSLFGRCANHDDFSEEFAFQSAAKLVLVTLAPFVPPGEDSFDGLGHEIVDKTNSADDLGYEIADKNSSADGLGAG